MPAPVEFLVVGQGLAGTALVWELLWRGREVLVVDPGVAGTSSRVAAGLVTPITGQRLALGWRVDTMLAAARPFYARIEAELGARHFHPRLVKRIFRSAEEAALWERRRHDPLRQPHIVQQLIGDAGPFGGCSFHGAHLDTIGYLDASRAAFRDRGCLLEDQIDPMQAAAWPARCIVFCQGFEASRNPYFDWIQWRAAKGEILTVQTRGLDPGTILSAGQWIVPVPESSESIHCSDEAAREPATIALARTGSTYDWDHLDSQPTPEARAQLEAGLAGLHQHPCEFVDHRAAVRPIICESRALIGRHPARENLAFFNGLGSKGSLHAPYFASQLAAHLVDQAPLEEFCDLRRNI
jgi:glycine oxidase